MTTWFASQSVTFVTWHDVTHPAVLKTYKEPVLICCYFFTYPVKCRSIVSAALRVISLLLCHVHWDLQNNLFRPLTQGFLHFSSFSLLLMMMMMMMMIVRIMSACVRWSYPNCTNYVNRALLALRQCSELFSNSLSNLCPLLDIMTENTRSFPQTIQANCNTGAQS